MGHQAGQADERADAAQALAEREVAARGGKARGVFGCAGQLERDHAAEAGHLRGRNGVAWVRRQAGIVDAGHARVRLQGLGEGPRGCRMAVHPEFERLQAAKREPAVKRARHAAERVLQELHRLEHRRVAGHDRALDHVRVPGEVLRHAVHDQVCPEVQRLLEVRGRKRVVYDDERARRVRVSRDGADVVDEQPRVGRRLEPHQARLGRDRATDRIQVREVDAGDAAPQRLEHPVQQPERAAVHVLRHDDARAGGQIRLQHRVLGGQPRGEHGAVAAVFQFGQHAFQPLTRGVVGARVVEAPVVAGGVLLIRGRLKDRRHDRSGSRIGGLIEVDGLGRKFHGVTPERRIRAATWPRRRQRYMSHQHMSIC